MRIPVLAGRCSDVAVGVRAPTREVNGAARPDLRPPPVGRIADTPLDDEKPLILPRMDVKWRAAAGRRLVEHDREGPRRRFARRRGKRIAHLRKHGVPCPRWAARPLRLVLCSSDCSKPPDDFRYRDSASCWQRAKPSCRLPVSYLMGGDMKANVPQECYNGGSCQVVAGCELQYLLPCPGLLVGDIGFAICYNVLGYFSDQGLPTVKAPGSASGGGVVARQCGLGRPRGAGRSSLSSASPRRSARASMRNRRRVAWQSLAFCRALGDGLVGGQFGRAGRAEPVKQEDLRNSS